MSQQRSSPYRLCRQHKSYLRDRRAPVPIGPSDHEEVLMGNLVLLAVFAVKLTAPEGFLEVSSEAADIIFLFGICIYLFLSLCSTTLAPLFHLTHFKNYQQFCRQQRQGEARFLFTILCFHEKTDSIFAMTPSGRFPLATNYAEERIYPASVKDPPVTITRPRAHSAYIFVEFQKDFEFVEDGELKLESAFDEFVGRNSKDSLQDFSCKL